MTPTKSTTPKREVTLLFEVTTPKSAYEVTAKGPVIKVGRDVNCHLRVTEDDGVSRMHAVIETTMVGDDLEVMAIDLGSVTYLKKDNGEWSPVNKCAMRVGDTIRISLTTITLKRALILDLPIPPVESVRPVPPATTTTATPGPVTPPVRPTTTSVPPPVNRRVAPRPFSLRVLVVRAVARLVRAARTIEAEDRNTRR